MFNIPFMKKRVKEDVVKEKPKKTHIHYEITLYLDGVRGTFKVLGPSNSQEHIKYMKKIRDCIQNNTVLRFEDEGSSVELPFPRKISAIDEDQWKCDKGECEDA